MAPPRARRTRLRPPRSRPRGSAPALAVLLPALLAGCGDAAAPAASAAAGGPPRLSVVTTVAPLTSITANVGGDRIALAGLVPEGTNSHTYEPPPRVAALLERADVVLVNGLQLEEPTVELAQANAKAGSEIVRLGDRVLPEQERIYDFSFPREGGKPNPHLWTDPTYAIKYAEQVRDVLVRRDPAGADTYRDNCARFVAKAQALSDALRRDQASVPPERRQLLTYHDAYAYFARTYGWEVVGAVQPANFEDPQPKEVARLVDQIRARRVPVVFGSEVFPSKVLEQIARETGARYESTLRDDDLPGAPGEEGHSWLGLMRYDFRTMIRGLGGTTDALDALDVRDVVPDRAQYPQ
ncbi:MAG: metal ABC transporter substrate-binding protein [Actinomycetota bacterium]|nr:metal ABC transporter substrate-binding protein [Actinomycetota bacterium]